MELVACAGGEATLGVSRRWQGARGLDAAQLGIMAVVGGTVSELGGGNFANGAMTAAFAFLFNHLGHLHNNRSQCIVYENKIRVKARLEAKGYLTLEDANLWYQIGEGETLTMDAEKLGIEELLEHTEFQSTGDKRLLDTFDVSFKLGCVYGTISVEFKGFDLTGQRVFSVLSDNYGFEMHTLSNVHEFIRNIKTVVGGFVAGEGIPYDIVFKNYIRTK
ncbi:MAG: hypothetical protein J6S96_03655 [Muribaculaceae bacterium]|nr:hypothetical protein [Muribaculaceae bacterium]